MSWSWGSGRRRGWSWRLSLSFWFLFFFLWLFLFILNSVSSIWILNLIIFIDSIANSFKLISTEASLIILNLLLNLLIILLFVFNFLGSLLDIIASNTVVLLWLVVLSFLDKGLVSVILRFVLGLCLRFI